MGNRPRRIQNTTICITESLSSFVKQVASQLGITAKELAEIAILKYCDDNGFRKVQEKQETAVQ